MGVCFSYSLRRRKSPEHEPLLASQTSSTDSLPEPNSHFQKAIDVLAALKANKYPSQDQLNSFFQLLLRSDVLDVNGNGVSGYGPVSDDVRKVVLDARELVEAVLMIGMEKNSEQTLHHINIGCRCKYVFRIDDDKFQELLFKSSTIDATPVRVGANVQVDQTVLEGIQNNGMSKFSL
jgi:hypothetical protein